MAVELARWILALSLLTASCFTAVASLPDADGLAGQWADSVMNILTAKERIAQLFVPRLDITDNATGYATLRNMVVKHGVGGILLGKGTARSYANMINRAQKEVRVPLMITLDGEWGPAMRVTDAPCFPYNMTLGAIQDDVLLYEYGREVARECRLLGVQVDFAPVLDVNSNPDNPVIGYRSFGEDADRVAHLGAAFCRGLEAGGVMAVGKHFPGHGDTSVDSHKALARVTHDRGTLDNVDLKPFKVCIDAGMSGIMVGHLNVPALDRSGTPASLSRHITTDLLRKELGFDGLIFTDALAMKGAVSRKMNNCVKAFQAGADVMLSSKDPVADIEAMAYAVRKGVIKQKDIDARCRRILMAKYRLGLSRKPSPVDDEAVVAELNSPVAFGLIDRLACASVTVLDDADSLLPLKGLNRNKIAVVSIGVDSKNIFSDYCAKYADVDIYGLTRGNFSSRTLAELANADVVIAGLFSNKAWAVAAYRKLRSSVRNVVPVFFMNPYRMAAYSESVVPGTSVAAYGDASAFQKAAAQALFGGIDVTGRFPVNVPGIGLSGQGVSLDKTRLGYAFPEDVGINPGVIGRIDSVVSECIAHKAFPGCQIAVVKGGKVIMSKGYGRLTYDSESPCVNEETVYDVASMTKPLSTVAALMLLYGEGAFSLDDSVANFVPELEGTDKDDIKVSALLYHESGLKWINIPKTVGEEVPGDVRKYRLRSDLFSSVRTDSTDLPVAKGIWCGDNASDTIMARIIDSHRGKGTYNYSCLNFCLLAEMIGNITSMSLDELVETEVYAPLGAWHTGYLPSKRFSVELIAPTEVDSTLRHQLLQGYVHDEIAAFSGGVQGNAGLFSTAEDVAKICQAWLDGGCYGGERIFSCDAVRAFTDQRSNAGRTPGFDTAMRYESLKSCGVSDSVYGHTGFTGTCFWVDPEHDLIYVFLCNKVYPDRNNLEFNRLSPRAAIMAEIYNALER